MLDNITCVPPFPQLHSGQLGPRNKTSSTIEGGRHKGAQKAGGSGPSQLGLHPPTLGTTRRAG